MSDWRSRGMSSADRDLGNPRPFGLLLVALLALLLLSDAVTGRVGIISAFRPSSPGMNELLQKIAFEATAQADEAHTLQTAPSPTAIPALQSSSGAAASDAGACEPSGDSRYCLYTVQEGDTLGGIAEQFSLQGAGLPGWQLVFESNKLELAGGEDLLVPGWVLRIPRSDAVLHLVLPGDSVGGLAVAYDVTGESIATANGLSDPNMVQIGDLLLIPSPNQVPPIVIPETSPPPEDDEQDEEAEEDAADGEATTDDTDSEEDEAAEASESSSDPDANPETDGQDSPPEEGSTEQSAESDGETPEGESPDTADSPDESDGEGSETDEGEDGSDQSDDAAEAGQPQAAPAVADDPTSMSWPVVLPLAITNYMSARHPLGMDFGLGQAVGSPIMAAAGGTVEFAGGDACCSYGYYVIVDHGNGLKSLYAHLSSISVSKGEVVGRGQMLGIAGNTGNSRGVHLHFEVYRNGTRVDPMNYLPR